MTLVNTDYNSRIPLNGLSGYDVARLEVDQKITVPAGTVMTDELLSELIQQHELAVKKAETMERYYKGKHDILYEPFLPEKDCHKADNRTVINLAKYIVDTVNGYFMGKPVKVTHPDETKNEMLRIFGTLNNIDDHNSEVCKYASINGRSYELMYVDEDGNPRVTYYTDKNGFIVYDDSVIQRELFGIYYTRRNGKLSGSYSDSENVYYFKERSQEETLDYTVLTQYVTDQGSASPHGFGEMPVSEVPENTENLGAFETVITIIDAINKAISAKENDVDYFADAYLLILGGDVDEEDLVKIKQNRIINVPHSGGDTGNVAVSFLDRPESDATQEHLLDWLMTFVFQISMSVNLYDERGLTSTSGDYLNAKMHVMELLASTKERKFKAVLNKRYRMLSHFPANQFQADDWLDIQYTFTRNKPKNIKEQTEIANSITGNVSKKTQLEAYPEEIVSDPISELEAYNEEYGTSTEDTQTPTLTDFITQNTTTDGDETTQEAVVERE